MRTYPLDSTQAASRLLAIVMISDGYISTSELTALSYNRRLCSLGVRPSSVDGVIEELYQDLMATNHCGAVKLELGTLDKLLGEIGSEELRSELFEMMCILSAADGVISKEELFVLDRAAANWKAPVETRS